MKDLQKYETSEKIRIVEGKLATVIDLFRQLQELTLPDERKLFRSQTQSPWYKLISKYFNHGENEIPINTARNYFPAQKNVKLIKGSEVPEEEKHFQIIPTKKPWSPCLISAHDQTPLLVIYSYCVAHTFVCHLTNRSNMNVELITKEDLQQFKIELVQELKQAFNSQQTNRRNNGWKVRKYVSF